MKRDEDIIAYDFQGWPYYKMNLKEVLLALGGKVDGDSISFDLHHPLLDVYPMVYTDDGMGYYVDDSFIVFAEASEDNTKITLHRERPEKSKKQEEHEVIESYPPARFYGASTNTAVTTTARKGMFRVYC